MPKQPDSVPPAELLVKARPAIATKNTNGTNPNQMNFRPKGNEQPRHALPKIAHTKLDQSRTDRALVLLGPAGLANFSLAACKVVREQRRTSEALITALELIAQPKAALGEVKKALYGDK